MKVEVKRVMEEKDKKRISKLLSLVLRHEPERIGIELDAQGWTHVKVLMQQAAKHKCSFNLDELKEVVATNDKQRFSFSEDGLYIRANQGHSVMVDLNLSPVEPPEYLFHGTVAKFIEGIQQEGLKTMTRQHVHLSVDKETAEKVGVRRGKPIILTLRAGEMHRDGHQFYCSENGVWLIEHVPTKYIQWK